MTGVAILGAGPAVAWLRAAFDHAGMAIGDGVGARHLVALLTEEDPPLSALAQIDAVLSAQEGRFSPEVPGSQAGSDRAASAVILAMGMQATHPALPGWIAGAALRHAPAMRVNAVLAPQGLSVDPVPALGWLIAARAVTGQCLRLRETGGMVPV